MLRSSHRDLHMHALEREFAANLASFSGFSPSSNRTTPLHAKISSHTFAMRILSTAHIVCRRTGNLNSEASCNAVYVSYFFLVGRDKREGILSVSCDIQSNFRRVLNAFTLYRLRSSRYSLDDHPIRCVPGIFMPPILHTRYRISFDFIQ
jgi:hypothetical protein